MHKDDFLKIVAEVLEISSADVRMDSNLEALGWDSLSNLTFLAKIDELMQKSIDADLLSSAGTVEDLFGLLHE